MTIVKRASTLLLASCFLFPIIPSLLPTAVASETGRNLRNTGNKRLRHRQKPPNRRLRKGLVYKNGAGREGNEWEDGKLYPDPQGLFHRTAQQGEDRKKDDPDPQGLLHYEQQKEKPAKGAVNSDPEQLEEGFGNRAWVDPSAGLEASEFGDRAWEQLEHDWHWGEEENSNQGRQVNAEAEENSNQGRQVNAEAWDWAQDRNGGYGRDPIYDVQKPEEVYVPLVPEVRKGARGQGKEKGTHGGRGASGGGKKGGRKGGDGAKAAGSRSAKEGSKIKGGGGGGGKKMMKSKRKLETEDRGFAGGGPGGGRKGSVFKNFAGFGFDLGREQATPNDDNSAVKAAKQSLNNLGRDLPLFSDQEWTHTFFHPLATAKQTGNSEESDDTDNAIAHSLIDGDMESNEEKKGKGEKKDEKGDSGISRDEESPSESVGAAGHQAQAQQEVGGKPLKLDNAKREKKKPDQEPEAEASELGRENDPSHAEEAPLPGATNSVNESPARPLIEEALADVMEWNDAEEEDTHIVEEGGIEDQIAKPEQKPATSGTDSALETGATDQATFAVPETEAKEEASFATEVYSAPGKETAQESLQEGIAEEEEEAPVASETNYEDEALAATEGDETEEVGQTEVAEDEMHDVAEASSAVEDATEKSSVEKEDKAEEPVASLEEESKTEAKSPAATEDASGEASEEESGASEESSTKQEKVATNETVGSEEEITEETVQQATGEKANTDTEAKSTHTDTTKTGVAPTQETQSVEQPAAKDENIATAGDQPESPGSHVSVDENAAAANNGTQSLGREASGTSVQEDAAAAEMDELMDVDEASEIEVEPEEEEQQEEEDPDQEKPNSVAMEEQETVEETVEEIEKPGEASEGKVTPEEDTMEEGTAQEDKLEEEAPREDKLEDEAAPEENQPEEQSTDKKSFFFSEDSKEDWWINDQHIPQDAEQGLTKHSYTVQGPPPTSSSAPSAGPTQMPTEDRTECQICTGGHQAMFPNRTIMHTKQTCQELAGQLDFSSAASCGQIKSDIPIDVQAYCGCPVGGTFTSWCKFCPDGTQNLYKQVTIPSLNHMSCGDVESYAAYISDQASCSKLGHLASLCCGTLDGYWRHGRSHTTNTARIVSRSRDWGNEQRSQTDPDPGGSGDLEGGQWGSGDGVP